MNIKFLLIVLLACFVLLSCSDDDAEFNKNIVGSWKRSFNDNDYPKNGAIYTFNSDQTGKIEAVKFISQNDYEVMYTLNIRNYFFKTDTKLKIQSQTVSINNGEYNVLDQYVENTQYILYLSSDSLSMQSTSPSKNIHSYKKIN